MSPSDPLGGRSAPATAGRAVAFWRTLQVLSLAAGGALRALWLARTRSLRSPEAHRRAVDALWAAEGRRLRQRAVALGGLLIKVGQFLSTRADVLPVAFTRELTALQDALPPVAWTQVQGRLREAYGDAAAEVFREVDPVPLAAASLAQVHAAELPDGQPVAVKLLRPGIEAIVEVDLGALHTVARLAQRWTSWGRRWDLLAIWQEFAEVTRAELDMPGEAARARRFHDLFLDDPGVAAPLPLDAWTRPGVLVLERVAGLRVDDPEGLRAAGVDPSGVARRLVASYMRQWLRHGFYHADPHPGNLFVSPQGTLIYVDFGMMGEVRPEDREALRKLVEGVVGRDPDRMVEGAVALGLVRPHADLKALRRAFGWFVDRLYAAQGRLRGRSQEADRDADTLSEDLQDFLYSHPFQIPARCTFLGRAMGVLRGIVALLDPEQDFMELLMAEARRELTAEAEAGAPAGLLSGDAAALGRALLDRLLRFPRQVGRLVDRLDQGEPLSTRVEGLPGGLDRLSDAVTRLARAVLAAGAAVAAALLPPWAAWGRDGLWLAAALLGLASLRRRGGSPPP